MRELAGLYARACAIAPPDAAKLAAWLAASRCDGLGAAEPRWQDLRDWALDFMLERARTGENQQIRLGELISVLLHEDLADEAWSTAADRTDQVSKSQLAV